MRNEFRNYIFDSVREINRRNARMQSQDAKQPDKSPIRAWLSLVLTITWWMLWEHVRKLVFPNANSGWEKLYCHFIGNEAPAPSSYPNREVNRNPFDALDSDLIQISGSSNSSTVKSFIGMVEYNSSSIPNCSKLLEPLEQQPNILRGSNHQIFWEVSASERSISES